MNKSFVNKLIVLVLLIVTPVQFSLAATVTELQKQLLLKQKELDANQSAAQNKAAEAKTLSSQITNLNGDITTTQQKIDETGGQISSTSSQIDNLTKTIDQKNLELAELKKKLNVAIVEIYRFSSRSNFDLLLNGSSLGMNTNESNYVAAIEIQVKSVNTQVETAKKDLENQKADVVKKQNDLNDLQSRQVSYQDGIQIQKSQKDKLLGMTVQQKVAYEQEASKAEIEITRVEEQIRVEIAKRTANSDGTYGSGPRVGQRVKRGDFIGIQGSTGFSTGDHVHFEVDTVQPMVGYTNPHSYINNGTMSWPLKNFRITQDYWEFWSVGAYPSTGGYHMGIDIAGPSGSPVFSPADGKVVLDECPSGCNRGYGHAWAMKVDNGPYVLLGHLR